MSKVLPLKVSNIESKGSAKGLLQLQLAEKKLYLHPSQNGLSGYLFTING